MAVTDSYRLVPPPTRRNWIKIVGGGYVARLVAKILVQIMRCTTAAYKWCGDDELMAGRWG